MRASRNGIKPGDASTGMKHGIASVTGMLTAEQWQWPGSQQSCGTGADGDSAGVVSIVS